VKNSYIESYGLALTITIEPEYELIGVSCVLLNVLDHVFIVLDDHLLEFNYQTLVDQDLLLYRSSNFVVFQFLHRSGYL
jgi:hypothetical protein